MSYVINGPTLIGDTGFDNTIQGTLTLADVCTDTGDLIYSSNATGLMTRLAAGAVGYVLTSNGPSTAPSWQADTNAIDDGFTAVLSAAQTVLAAAATTPVAIQGFTAAAAPGFDTTGGWFAAGQAGGVWTPGTAGKYHVCVTVSFTNTDGAAASNAGNRTVRLVAAGSNYIVKQFQPTGATAAEQQISFASDILLTAVQTVSVEIFSSTTAGGMTVTTQGTVFSITRYT